LGGLIRRIRIKTRLLDGVVRDIAKLPSSGAQVGASSEVQGSASLVRTTAHITSSPSGGEIYVDGKFVGNTPSDMAIAAGEHFVRLLASGREWSRTIQITSGEINLHAELGASATDDSSGQPAAGQGVAAKDRAVDQMRRIVDSIRQCPELTGSDGSFNVAIVYHHSPRILEWDVLASNSLRAPFQGYVLFDLPKDLQETDEAKRSKELHSEYELVVKPALSKLTEYRYEFDLGSDAPELRKAFIKFLSPDFKPYDPPPNSEGPISCWDKVARSPGSAIATHNNSPQQ
jgi:hypothetical protein